jgi:hypothetical protein
LPSNPSSRARARDKDFCNAGIALDDLCVTDITKIGKKQMAYRPPNCQENIEKFLDPVQVAEKVFGHIVI